MLTRFRRPILTAALAALGVTAEAAAQVIVNEPDRSYVYSSTGISLPAPVQAFGQDEVQAAGGVACRSAVGGGGPYVDVGLVGSNDLYKRDTASAYARVVVPLGRQPKRLDCSRLYELEIQRLRLELEMAKMSMPVPDGAARLAGQVEPRETATP